MTGRDPLELRSGVAARNPQPVSPGLHKLFDAMLSLDPARRPRDMVRAKKRLEYALYRPAMIYMMGIVCGIVYVIIRSIFWLISLPLPFSTPLIASPLPLGLALIVEMQIEKRLGLPQKTPWGFRRFWLPGVLTLAVFWELFHLLFFHSW